MSPNDTFINRVLRPRSPGSWDVFVNNERVGHVQQYRASGGGWYFLGTGWSYNVDTIQGRTAKDCAARLCARLEREYNDFFFDITPIPEPEMGATHLVIMAARGSGRVIERFDTDNPGGAVEAAREAQEYTLEERLGEFGIEWEREQADRMGR